MTGLTVHVMSVPDRRASVEEFRAQWAGDLVIHEDPDRNGILWNHERVIRAMREGEPTYRGWHVVVQDDVEPVRDAEHEMRGALMFCPPEASFLSMSHFGNRTAGLVKRGIPYGVGIRTMWGQAMAFHESILPTYHRLVQDVIRWGPPKAQQWDDGMVKVHHILHGTLSAVTARAIVVHRHMPSTVGHLSAFHRTAGIRADERPTPKWTATPRSVAWGLRTFEPQHRDLAHLIRQRRAEQ